MRACRGAEGRGGCPPAPATGTCTRLHHLAASLRDAPCCRPLPAAHLGRRGLQHAKGAHHRLGHALRGAADLEVLDRPLRLRAPQPAGGRVREGQGGEGRHGTTCGGTPLQALIAPLLPAPPPPSRSLVVGHLQRPKRVILGAGAHRAAQRLQRNCSRGGEGQQMGTGAATATLGGRRALAGGRRPLCNCCCRSPGASRERHLAATNRQSSHRHPRTTTARRRGEPKAPSAICVSPTSEGSAPGSPKAPGSVRAAPTAPTRRATCWAV